MTPAPLVTPTGGPHMHMVMLGSNTRVKYKEEAGLGMKVKQKKSSGDFNMLQISECYLDLPA